MGQVIDFCIEMSDFPPTPPIASALPRRLFAGRRWRRSCVAWWGNDAEFSRQHRQYLASPAGKLVVTPNYGREVLELALKMANLVAVSTMIPFFSFFVYRPVRNALAPSEAILGTLWADGAGDLKARMRLASR